MRITKNTSTGTTQTTTTTRRGRRATVAAVAFAAALVGGSAAPAFGAAASPNDSGTNCHGVWLSYLSTSGMSPGQLHHDYGMSAQDVQATADIVCGP